MLDMHVIILTAVKIRLIKFSGSFWYSSVRRLRKLYFLKILLKVPTRASLLALAKSIYFYKVLYIPCAVIYYLLTESDVVTGKSQTEALM